MRKIIIKYSILLCILVLGLSSCKKFLDEKSDKSLSELKSLNDLQAMIDDDGILNKESTPGFGETSADDIFVTQNDFNSLGDDSKSAYTWSPYDYRFGNDWSYSYKGIYTANHCLDYIDKIPKTIQNSAQWDNVKGSAFFIRAYRNLNLIWVYAKAYDDIASQADLGIVLRLNSDPSIQSVRSSVKDCYDRVISDAKEATVYLPNNPQHVMRPSKAAAYGLLARAYLSMRKYDSAFKYSDLCLQIKNDLLDYNNPLDVTPLASLSFKPFNKEIIYYTTQTQFYSAKNPLAKALVDTMLYATYDSNDLRKSVFFKSKSGYFYFKGTYSTVSNEDLFTGISTDEMYLTRAECHARANRLTEAMNDLNAILTKRWKSGTFVAIPPSGQQQAINMILIERRKELLMRGLRWIDIKRLNKEGANIILKRVADKIYTLSPNSDKYALPLPNDILELTGMPQNPGW
jgi:tetratricopeptide (TPR) repeat protein